MAGLIGLGALVHVPAMAHNNRFTLKALVLNAASINATSGAVVDECELFVDGSPA